MKNSIKLSFVVLFTIVSTLFSCSSDDDNNDSDINELVGIWQRVDSDNGTDNKFVFNADNSGLKIYAEFHEGGTAISNASSLEWSSSNNNLHIIENEEIDTPYSFNEEGQLILSSVSNIPFNRVDSY